MPVAVAVVGVVATLVGCASAVPEDDAFSPISDTESGAFDAPFDIAAEWSGGSELIGLWELAFADEGVDRAWLRADGAELTVWSDCGSMSFGWRALEAGFLAAPGASSGECEAGAAWEAAFGDAAFFQLGDDAWRLLDGDGAVVVTAIPVRDEPPRPPGFDESFLEPPVLADGQAALFLPGAGLPEVYHGADLESIQGRWQPRADFADGDGAYLEFSGASFSGSDGCNGVAGSLRLGHDGQVLTVVGASTEIGCAGAPVGAWMARTDRLGFDGDALVLIDRAGERLAYLEG